MRRDCRLRHGLVLRTLADHQLFTIRAFCQACDRSVELDQPALTARFGGDVLLETITRSIAVSEVRAPA